MYVRILTIESLNFSLILLLYQSVWIQSSIHSSIHHSSVHFFIYTNDNHTELLNSRFLFLLPDPTLLLDFYVMVLGELLAKLTSVIAWQNVLINNPLL